MPLTHVPDAERAVLGALLTAPGLALEVMEGLSPDHFSSPAHAEIYRAMENIHATGTPLGLIPLKAELDQMGVMGEVGGVGYVGGLMEKAPFDESVGSLIGLIQDRYIRRRLQKAAVTINELALTADEAADALDRAEAEIMAVGERQDEGRFRKLGLVLPDAFDFIQKCHDNPGGITGLPTGFERLDRVLGGLQPSDYILLAARPSMGKTAMALNIAQNVALDQGKVVAFFSLEMSAMQLAQRLLTSEARVDSSRVRSGRIGDDEWSLLTQAGGALGQAGIYIDDQAALSAIQIRSRLRRICARVRPDLVVLDYLQLMTGPRSESKQQQVAEISRNLKAIAKEFKVPFLVLSQLSRACELRENKRPVLADLRDSGALEQDADVVMFIYRGAVYGKEEDGNRAELIVSKHRNGPVGMVPLAFVSEYTRFEPLEVRYNGESQPV